MNDRCAFHRNQTFTPNQLMVESDGSVFAKRLLGRNNKHLYYLRVAQYLSPADQ